jgi:adenylate cyclase
VSANLTKRDRPPIDDHPGHGAGWVAWLARWRDHPLARRAMRLVRGPFTVERVPERIRGVIAESEAQSEVLVCCIQIVAIAVFAVLYTLSPKAFPPDVPFQPVPWALAAYSGFTLLRLRLAVRRRLTPGFLALSIVVDVAVLLLTIWSFHLQYQAPASLYLKAPTVMYAFILIALRALRFEARYVLLTGGAAALGWLLLLAYALAHADEHTRITHSFRDYVMSYDILIGAELDKIVSLVMVAVILAVAVTRARLVLCVAATERKAGEDLARFLAPEVAATIKQADDALAPGQGELRQAAIVVVDLRGFTRLTEQMSPSAVMRLLGEYQARIVPCILRHGGTIDKYLGDGILASFGAAATSATCAADALRAAEAILTAAGAWGQDRAAAGAAPVRIGIGIATGPVMFGVVGNPARLEYTVIGDPVNLAAKLEAQTKLEQVRALTTLDTLLAGERQGYVPAAPLAIRRRVRVEGIAGALDLVVLG